MKKGNKRINLPHYKRGPNNPLESCDTSWSALLLKARARCKTFFFDAHSADRSFASVSKHILRQCLSWTWPWCTCWSSSTCHGKMLWGLKGSCWRNAVFLNLKTTVPLKPSCSTIVMMVSKCFQHISYGSPTLPSSYRKTTVSPKPSCSWKCGGVGPILWYCGWSTVQRFLLFWKTTVPPKRSFSNFGYLVPMNTTLLYIVAFDHYCGYIPQPLESQNPSFPEDGCMCGPPPKATCLFGPFPSQLRQLCSP